MGQETDWDAEGLRIPAQTPSPPPIPGVRCFKHLPSKVKKEAAQAPRLLFDCGRYVVAKADSSVSPAAPESSLQAALHQSVFLSAMSAQPGRDLSLCWEQHRKLLPGVSGVHAETVQHWSVQQVGRTSWTETRP